MRAKILRNPSRWRQRLLNLNKGGSTDKYFPADTPQPTAGTTQHKSKYFFWGSTSSLKRLDGVRRAQKKPHCTSEWTELYFGTREDTQKCLYLRLSVQNCWPKVPSFYLCFWQQTIKESQGIVNNSNDIPNQKVKKDVWMMASCPPFWKLSCLGPKESRWKRSRFLFCCWLLQLAEHWGIEQECYA